MINKVIFIIVLFTSNLVCAQVTHDFLLQKFMNNDNYLYKVGIVSCDTIVVLDTLNLFKLKEFTTYSGKTILIQNIDLNETLHKREISNKKTYFCRNISFPEIIISKRDVKIVYYFHYLESYGFIKYRMKSKFRLEEKESIFGNF